MLSCSFVAGGWLMMEPTSASAVASENGSTGGKRYLMQCMAIGSKRHMISSAFTFDARRVDCLDRGLDIAFVCSGPALRSMKYMRHAPASYLFSGCRCHTCRSRDA